MLPPAPVNPAGNAAAAPQTVQRMQTLPAPQANPTSGLAPIVSSASRPRPTRTSEHSISPDVSVPALPAKVATENQVVKNKVAEPKTAEHKTGDAQSIAQSSNRALTLPAPTTPVVKAPVVKAPAMKAPAANVGFSEAQPLPPKSISDKTSEPRWLAAPTHPTNASDAKTIPAGGAWLEKLHSFVRPTSATQEQNKLPHWRDKKRARHQH